MGLDMYLRARTYFSDGEWRGEKNNQQFEEIIKTAEVEEYLDTDNCFRSAYVEVSVGYWRKSNQIHHWFVENIQGGVDECQEALVGREKLVELKENCEQVLESPVLAEQILPVSEGFFFGSTEYDEYYFEDIKDTVKIIDRVLQMPEEWDFVYQSSW